MSRGVNKAIIVGNLGADPETRYTAGGTAVTNINVATSEVWNDKSSGQKQERTEWHRIVFFARLAEVAGEYLRKGAKVYVEGRIQTRKWQGQDGQDRYTTEIVAHEMQMLDSRGGQSQSGSQRAINNQNQGQRRGGRNESGGQGGQNDPRGVDRNGNVPTDPGFDDDLDDDIPF